MTENWNIQWSIKSPAGSMLNLRTERADEMQILLESLNDLIPGMLAVEQTLTGGGNIAAVIPLSQPQRQAAVGQSQPGAQPQWGQQPPQQNFAPQQGGYIPPQPQYQPPQQQPQAPQGQGQAPLCNHGIPAKFVPPGVSKSSGRPYPGFWACSLPRDQQCEFKG